MGKVIILVGPPGSGKSYFIKEYTKTATSPYVVCSMDNFFETDGKHVYDATHVWHAHSECFARFTEALLADVPLIFVDNQNAKKGDRSKYINRAIEYGYEVELKVLPRDIETVIRQNKTQERIDAGKAVPDEYLTKRMAKFDIEPGIWKAEDDGGRSYKLTKVLEQNEFIRQSKK